MSISIDLYQILCIILPAVIIIGTVILHNVIIASDKTKKFDNINGIIFIISIFAYLPISLTIYYGWLKPYKNLPIEWKELAYNCDGFYPCYWLNEIDRNKNNKIYQFWKNRWPNPSKLTGQQYKNIQYFIFGHFSNSDVYKEVSSYYEVSPNDNYWKAK